jgi:hypothetical protein
MAFLACYVALGKQLGSQNITQHRELKRLIQNLFGSCVKGAVDTLFNVAGHGPRGIYHHWDIAGGHIPFKRAVTSSPFIPGKRTSIMIRSGCMLQAFSRAS